MASQIGSSTSDTSLDRGRTALNGGVCPKPTVVFLVAVVLIDVGASVVLAMAGYLMIFALCISRLCLLSIGTFLGVRCALGELQCCRGCCRRWNRAAVGDDPGMSLISADRMGTARVGEIELQRSAYDKQAGNQWKRWPVLVFCFVAITAQSVFTGLHALRLSSAEATMGVAFVVCIVCMNVEFLLQTALVGSLTTQSGVLVPSLHEHPLHYENKQCLTLCSICTLRLGHMTGGYEVFRCRECETSGKGSGKGKGAGGFAVCLSCYRKSQTGNNVQEGVMRGDRGAKPPLELTTLGFVRRFLRLTAPFYCQFLVTIVFVFAAQGSQVLLPSYQGGIINALIESDRDEFVSQLTLLIAVSLLAAFFGSVQGLAVNIVSKKLTLSLRSEMFRSLVKQDMALFDGTMVGQLTARMSGDANSITQPIQQFLSQFLAGFVQFVGSMIMCLHTSWRLTLLAVTFLGPVIYMTGIYADWSQGINKLIWASLGDTNAIATESLRNIRTVRAFGADRFELDAFQVVIMDAWVLMRKDAVASAGVNGANYIVTFAASALIYWYGGLAVLDGSDSQLSIGNLVTFNMYWTMLKTAVRQMNNMLSVLIISVSAGKRVFEVIDLEPDIVLDNPTATPLRVAATPGERPPALAIEFQEVWFTYQMRPGSPVLRGLSLAIAPGSTVALVGKSGAGKTTIINMLLRFYDAQQGQILVDSHPLPKVDLRTWQRRIGVVTQDTQIFARSVRDNLTYGLGEEEYTQRSVEVAARAANAHEFITAMDGGYDSMLGENGGRLSGGQRQRLSIARAMLRQPQLLLLDEATSALDSENEQQIQKALDEMVSLVAGSCTVVLVAHRLSTVMGADKLFVIHEGRVYEEGTHENLLRNGQIYAKLVKRQVDKEAQQVRETFEDDAPISDRKGKGRVVADGKDDESDDLAEGMWVGGKGKGKADKGKGGGKGKKGRAGSKGEDILQANVDADNDRWNTGKANWKGKETGYQEIGDGTWDKGKGKWKAEKAFGGGSWVEGKGKWKGADTFQADIDTDRASAGNWAKGKGKGNWMGRNYGESEADDVGQANSEEQRGRLQDSMGSLVRSSLQHLSRSELEDVFRTALAQSGEMQ